MLETFDLSALIGPNDNLWVSASSRHGAVYGVPRAGGNLPSAAELADIVEDFEDGIQYARPIRGLDVGAALTDLLFGEPEIAALFHRSRGAAAAQGNQVVVRVLAAPSKLAAVPWELILDPEGGTHQYLTLAPDVHIVRAARSRTYPVRSELLEPPLNILLVLSSPTRSADDNAFSFDLFEEKRNLLQELAALEDSDILRIDVEEHPTLETLRRRIGSRRGGYHIVHYLGHAAPGGLYLEDRAGRATLVEATTITELLRLCPQLRLTLFAGCETARSPIFQAVPETREWRNRLSTADQCVRESCPTVIGMRAVLPFRTEWLFARFFYQGLASGYAIVDAVRLARSAIRGDEYVGGDLLDWAVPSVIAGSDQLGPLLEPPKAARRRVRPKPAELKFDIVEKDREFFSRLVPLRTAIDALGGGSARILTVTGPAGVGKTALVDRALQDLDSRVDCVLYFKAGRLAEEKDPVLRLASWVAELLTSVDQRQRARQDEWDGASWWQRLLADLADTRFVIVIDDVHKLRPTAKSRTLKRLTEAVLQLADRRGSCRIALVAPEIPAGLLDRRLEYVSSLRLLPFTWEEVWVWIRRNLPALTRYGSVGLSEYYGLLGNDLVAWRELGHRVTQARGEVDIAEMARSISIARQPAAPTTAHARSPVIAPRTQRPLRIAIAGPFIKSAEAFATAFTQFAAQYGVGGRVVTAQQSVFSSIAELLPIDSPFGENGGATEARTLRWLEEAVGLRPDVVLLDYGAGKVLRGQGKIIEKLASSALMIAAAGNEGPSKTIAYPARLRNVLAVGALENEDAIAEYSSIDLKHDKPELHALGHLRDTALSAALKTPDAKGTSFSALRVAAAAALVWSQSPGSDRLWVRELLLNSARLLKYKDTAAIRVLDIRKALQMSRSTAILGALQGAELTYAELQGRLGLSSTALEPVLAQLVERSQVQVRDDSGLLRYRAAASPG